MATHKASAVTIDEFELPKGSNATGALIAATLMILSARRRFIQPGSLLHDQVIARSARASKYAKPVQDALFYTLFGLHGIETVYFALTKLKKHSVKIFSPVWVKWLIAVFLGGVFTQKQFDEVVEKKELKTIKEI